MKRKRPSHKKFKAVPHEIADGSNLDCLESHVEVHAGLDGRIGGHTIYRKGLAMSSPPRSDTEEFPLPAAPPSNTFDAVFDMNTAASSDGMQPTNVRCFQSHIHGEINNVCRLTDSMLGYPIVSNISLSCYDMKAVNWGKGRYAARAAGWMEVYTDAVNVQVKCCFVRCA